MSVAYQRWELRAAGAPGVTCNKINTGAAAAAASPSQAGHQLYASESTSSAVLRCSQQQQQQHQPHELPACNLSSFSMYVHQYPTATTIGGDTAKIHLPGAAVSKASSSPHPQTSSVHWEPAHHPDASSKPTMVATVSSTLSLPDPQESRVAEEQRWAMSAAAGAVHKLPGSAMMLNVVTPYYGTQGGLSLMIKTQEAGMTADYTPASALPKAENCCTRTTIHSASSTDLMSTVDEPSCTAKKRLEAAAAAAPSPLPSSASSSSICNGKEPTSCSSERDITDSGGTQEAQSAYRGPLHQMSALESSLPIKRPGLSKFFGGKSRSFSSLADVSSVSDLAKPNNPYAKRRRMGSFNSGPLDHHRHRSYPPLSLTSVASIIKKPVNNRSRTTNTLTIAIKLGGLREAEETEEADEEEEEEEEEEDKQEEATEKDYVNAHHSAAAAAAASSQISASLMSRSRPSRSFSLTDLPMVPPQPSSSPPTNLRKSFTSHHP